MVSARTFCRSKARKGGKQRPIPHRTDESTVDGSDILGLTVVYPVVFFLNGLRRGFIAVHRTPNLETRARRYPRVARVSENSGENRVRGILDEIRAKLPVTRMVSPPRTSEMLLYTSISSRIT